MQTIQSGVIGSDKNHGDWHLHEGNGSRSIKLHVAFESSYEKVPNVRVGLTSINSTGNVRITATPIDITLHGFHVQIETWAESHIFGAQVSWIAIGN